MNQKNDYHISFFKPTTERAKTNRNMVLWLISIWAVAVFGFHFLLRAIEKPTPEPELIAFNQVWENVKSGNASNDEVMKFAQSALHVTGKIFIDADSKKALDNGISWALMQLADSAQKIAVNTAVVDFEKVIASKTSITNADYISAKKNLIGISQNIIGLSPNSVLASILPFELHAAYFDVFTSENQTIVEACMPKYMTHNRSVLTDTKFLGFPFHYFYSAVFLLILFIALCYAYCVLTDRYNKRMDIVE
ncbi:MAG: DUF4212 domain-containing protein [Salinivirgaceae bacterium]|nr:DUF4212 domain-containing protein [Salinivirgaceae bacterium]